MGQRKDLRLAPARNEIVIFPAIDSRHGNAEVVGQLGSAAKLLDDVGNRHG